MIQKTLPRLNLSRHPGTSLLAHFSRRRFTSSPRQSQQQHPSHAEPKKPESSTFKQGMSAYRPFGAPFFKVFLGAIFTYQVIYYVWMKLETSEKKLLKNEEIRGLEKEAKQLVANAKS